MKQSGAECPELLTTGDVAQLLGVPLRTLTWWVYALNSDRRYTRFEIARRSGGTRQIDAPIKPIKDIQRRLADVLTQCYASPPNVHGFVTGRSPTTNARRHQSQHWVLRVDIEDFFPSINFGRVRGMFMAFPFDYPSPVATLLAQVCCHDNHLPQGAPTSPIVSNYICRRMDTELARLARTERCYYTRYADDLCFSTDRTVFPSHLATPSPPDPAIVGPAIESIVLANGFVINAEKTRLMQKNQRQRVTGLVVNRKAKPPRRYIKSLRSLLYIWDRHGEAEAQARFADLNAFRNWPPGKAAPEFRKIVQGRVQYVGSVVGWASPTYRRLALKLQQLDDSFQPSTLVTLPARSRVNIYTEGETDQIHLKAALAHLHELGEYADLILTFPDDSVAHSDRELLEVCKGLARTKQSIPCICLFDRDNPDVLAKAIGSGPDSKDWGNGVAAVAVVPPEWRPPSDPICIELLYTDEDISRRDGNDRRLYIRSEFDSRNGHHRAERVHISMPERKTLVRDDVFDRDSGESVGLSKMDFAEDIAGATPGFEDVSFDGFRLTLDAIREAAARALSAIRSGPGV